MTLTSILNQLIALFLEKDYISVADFAAVKVDDKLADKREELVRAALKTLEEGGMIRPIGNDSWILVAPLNSAGQDVHLSMPVCNEIAEIINMDLESKGVDERVSSLEIHEGHILGLIGIIGELLSNEVGDD